MGPLMTTSLGTAGHHMDGRPQLLHRGRGCWEISGPARMQPGNLLREPRPGLGPAFPQFLEAKGRSLNSCRFEAHLPFLWQQRNWDWGSTSPAGVLLTFSSSLTVCQVLAMHVLSL